MRRPVIGDQTTAVLVALAVTGAGLFLLYDAFEGHGLRPPWPIRALAPW